MGDHPQEDIPWHEFIQSKLLTTDCGITGVAVLSKKGVCGYTYGKLANDHHQDWIYFTTVFRDSTTEEEGGSVSKLSLIVDNDCVQFIPFKISLSSVYAISAGDLFRLVICSFSLGVLVCVSEPPMSKAVTAVENICSHLRM